MARPRVAAMRVAAIVLINTFCVMFQPSVVIELGGYRGALNASLCRCAPAITLSSFLNSD